MPPAAAPDRTRPYHRRKSADNLGADACAALLRLAAQAVYAVLLVGEDVAGERQSRIEPQLREGVEHGARFDAGVELTDDATPVAGVADRRHDAGSQDP